MAETSTIQKSKNQNFSSPHAIEGRLLAIDYGTVRVGVAISDETNLSVNALASLPRTSWKKLLREIINLRERFDARGVVIGLPLRMDNSESEMASEVRRIARNLQLSLDVPVFLQDEKLTSRAAREMMNELKNTNADEHSIAAMIILRDYLEIVNQASQGNDGNL
jgi:putative holliday junction resolvase